ncbi:toxin synthetase [Pseudozyma hubeiensis SY62]|uniref:Toxin synthetase n=1 Tax=Pseudozyma hubeiensis (strain SY62) TaxID=1305764 RepID=R9P9F7_PSEHS|nr:toxin synthetase [Pseudozyma hubeiensis SY62]GAC94725.1 toxin synthetase [Pseudozyma hubeiensis SY62]
MSCCAEQRARDSPTLTTKINKLGEEDFISCAHSTRGITFSKVTRTALLSRLLVKPCGYCAYGAGLPVERRAESFPVVAVINEGRTYIDAILDRRARRERQQLPRRSRRNTAAHCETQRRKREKPFVCIFRVCQEKLARRVF